MEYNLGDNPVTSHSWNANRTRKFDLSIKLLLEVYQNIVLIV